MTAYKYNNIEIPQHIIDNLKTYADAAHKSYNAINGIDEKHWDTIMGTYYKLAIQQLANIGITDRFATMDILENYKLQKV
jgi:hypothetical protein